MLTVLPCSGQKYKPYGQVEHTEQAETVTADGDEGGTAEGVEVLLLQTLLSALVSNAGFRIPKVRKFIDYTSSCSMYSLLLHPCLCSVLS